MMNDREVAKRIVADVFNIDIKGDIGRMARYAVPKEDKRAIVDRVHRLIVELRENVSRETRDAHGRTEFLPRQPTVDMDTR